MIQDYFSIAKILSITLFSFLLTITLSFAAPLETVNNTNDAGAGSLRQAIADVDPGGEIVFNLPGAAPHTIFISSTLLIDKDMTIAGPGAELLTVDGAAVGTVVISVNDGVAGQSEVEISGIAVDGGLATTNGIFNRDNLTLNNVVVTGTRDGVVVAGQFSVGALQSINDCLLSGNTQSGLFVFGGLAPSSEGSMVMINRTTISNNEDFGIINFATQVDSAVSSTVIINKSTISNQPIGIFNDGGNVQGATGGVAIMRNSTISGSSNVGFFNAGPEVNGALGPAVMISSSTIADNGAGLIYNSDDIDVLTMEVKNSIIANNEIDCSVLLGGLTALGVNLDTDGSCEGFTPVSAAALNLGPLQNNGGPTETHALIPPSVAIGAVSDCTFIDGTPVLEDQRCFLRLDQNCDAGAFEFGAAQQLPRNVPTLSTWGAIATVILIGISGAICYGRRKIVV